MKIIPLFFVFFLNLSLFAQTAPNFLVTDTEGVEHRLHEDHLQQGQTVVIELFFVACPPCRSAAPTVQQRYVEWGEGQYDVEFIKLSTQSGDSNADVAGFKAEFGTTFPGVGADGGAAAARMPYQNGTFGPYYGTPQFSVIAPDGTVNHGVPLSSLSAAIAATGSGMMEPEFTTINLSSFTQSNTPPESITFMLSSGSGGPTYNITQLTGGSNQFDYPSDNFPELSNPIITVEVTGPVKNNAIKAPDLLRIVKHILDQSILEDPAKLLAADVNSDDKIKPSDLLSLQKVVVELNDYFPNGTPSWKTIPASFSVPVSIGNTVNLEFQLVKIGDVTF